MSKEPIFSDQEQALAARFYDFLAGALPRSKGQLGPMEEPLTNLEANCINHANASYGHMVNKRQLAILAATTFDGFKMPVSKYEPLSSMPAVQKAVKPAGPVYDEAEGADTTTRPATAYQGPLTPSGKRPKGSVARVIKPEQEAGILAAFDGGKGSTLIAYEFNIHQPLVSEFLKKNGREVVRGKKRVAAVA